MLPEKPVAVKQGGCCVKKRSGLCGGGAFCGIPIFFYTVFLLNFAPNYGASQGKQYYCFT